MISHFLDFSKFYWTLSIKTFLVRTSSDGTLLVNTWFAKKFPTKTLLARTQLVLTSLSRISPTRTSLFINLYCPLDHHSMLTFLVYLLFGTHPWLIDPSLVAKKNPNATFDFCEDERQLRMRLKRLRKALSLTHILPKLKQYGRYYQQYRR